MARKATNTSKETNRKQRTARKESVIPRQQKPVFRTGTLFTLVLFAGLIALSFYLKKQKEITPEETPTGQATNIFTELDGAPTSIEIKPAVGETVKVARNSDNAWAIELPYATEADQGLAEAAATQISSLRILDTIDADPSVFGFDTPGFVITVKFADGKSHILEVGDVTPTNSGYYVRLDNVKMMITDMSGIDALLQLTSAPPYLHTPTPSALPPTETPLSPTEIPVSSTPEVSVTPTP